MEEYSHIAIACERKPQINSNELILYSWKGVLEQVWETGELALDAAPLQECTLYNKEVQPMDLSRDLV